MFTKLAESCINTSQQASVSYKSGRHSAFAVEIGATRAASPVDTHVTDGLKYERGEGGLYP